MITFAGGDSAVLLSLPSLTNITSLANITSVVLEILVISVGGAGAALLFVGIRHLGRTLFRSRASNWETPPAWMTNAVPATDCPRAPTSERAIELNFDERPRSHRPERGVAGELWVKEYVNRLRSILPGIRLESPSPSPQPDGDVVELDSSVSCVVDKGDVGVLCASSVVVATRSEAAGSFDAGGFHYGGRRG
jgi:hypothetical protein